VVLAVVTAALAVGLSLAGCGAANEPTRVVRMGFLRGDLHQLAYYVAVQKGFFADEGLDVKEAGAFSAGPEEMSAFSAGDLDMGYVGTAPVMTFVAQDMATVKIVAQANQEGSAIVARNGLEADDVVALKGRAVAIPGYSTVQDLILRLALKGAGLAPGDVNIIVLKPPQMISALAAAQIDAFVAWEPYPAQALAQKAGRVLSYSKEIWPGHPCCMLVVDQRFLDAEPETVKKVVAAHARATRYIRDNPAEAADMAYLFTGQDRDVVAAAMKDIKFFYTPDPKGLQKYAEFLKQAGIIKSGSPAAFARKLLDTEFLPKEAR
jgi:NitT/TauT family transport system substrate-binding protein